MARIAALLLLITSPVFAQAPEPQQRVSLWASHALQNSIQGSQLRIAAHIGVVYGQRFTAQADALYASSQEMLAGAPADPQYREWVTTVKRYDTLLWSIVGKPATQIQPRLDDLEAVALANASVSRAIYQYQVRRLGGRLKQVPDVDPLADVQELSGANSQASAEVKKLALVGVTIVKLCQTLPPAEPPTREPRYREALQKILGIAQEALRDPEAVVPAPPEAPPVTGGVVPPKVVPDGLPGNGGLPIPR